jgi:choline dehydrogenase-like flavoprotein
MHRDLQDVNEEFLDFDFCIIGSGPAGLSLASKLIDANINFVLLESGDISPNNKYQELNVGYSKGKRALNLVNSRLRCFGGAGKIWAGVCRPIDPSEFKNEDNRYGGWPIFYSDLEKYYKEASKILDLEYENFFNDDWKNQAYLASKFPSFAKNDSILSGVNYQRSPLESRDLTNSYKNKIINSKNFELITNATVIDLIQNKNHSIEQVVIKSYSGKESYIKAKTVILCAGAIENPRILLNSSLNDNFKVNKFLGTCFMSHPAFSNSGSIVLNKNTSKNNSKDQTLKKDFGFEMNLKERQVNGVLRHNIHIRPSPPGNDKDKNIASIIGNNISELKHLADRVKRKLFGINIFAKEWTIDVAIEQEPRLENYISLANTFDLHGKKQVEVFWDSISEKEMKTVLEAVKAVGRESALKKVGVVKASDDLISKEIFNQDDAINHHIGTTRMATSRSNGVVDSNLKCFDFDNLYIAGSSVFPTSSIVNPTFTIVALSLRLGEYLINQAKV